MGGHVVEYYQLGGAEGKSAVGAEGMVDRIGTQQFSNPR